MMRLPAFALCLLIAGCNFKQKEADLVIHNATIYTVDEGFSVQQAMAIKDGKIVAIGKERDILNNFRYKEAVDAGRKYIYPGFIDSHCHFAGLGRGLQQVDLTGCKSFDELLLRVQKFADQNPGQGWIVGRGWDHTDWPGREWPSKDLLDEHFPGRPILLSRIDGHAALASQAALDIAGFTAQTRIPGGILETKQGQLTGLIKENARDSLMQFIPEADAAVLRDAFLKAQRKCFETGLTTVVDAGLEKKIILAIDSLQRRGELDIRIYAMAADNPENFAYFLGQGPLKTERLHVRSFKFYADGSLGSRSACLLHHYADAPGEYGIMTITPEQLREKAQKLHEKGFQANTHCIGDSANRTVLKIYGEILGENNDRRWRIEHAQVVNPADRELFGRYNVLPSVQSTHATSDMKWAGERLGAERLLHAYAYKDLLQQNGMVLLGTDFPVEEVDPLHTFYAAVFRKNTKSQPEGGFLPQNALSRKEALMGMTIWGAIGAFEENEKGSLEQGKWADFVILDRDIMTCSEKDLLRTQVVSTYVNGKKVY